MWKVASASFEFMWGLGGPEKESILKSWHFESTEEISRADFSNFENLQIFILDWNLHIKPKDSNQEGSPAFV